MASKLEIVATQIRDRIHNHDPDHGGVCLEITGAPGSGKTSAMLSIVRNIMKDHPKEKVFFSNTYFAPMQSLRIGLENHKILVKRGAPVTFHDRDKRLKQIYPEVTYFSDFDELYELAERGKINAVFFGNRAVWRDYLHYLRSVGEWCHVCFDEFGEVAPAHRAGEEYWNIGRFSDDLKEVRKCMINVFENTQSVTDIDFRVRSKIMIFAYLPGARANKNGRVTQAAIDNLDLNRKLGNEAYLEFSGRFGKLRFKDIFPPAKQHWEARIPEEDRGDKNGQKGTKDTPSESDT